MTGHHSVRLFHYDGDETHVPAPWKPYANIVVNGGNMIVARKWHRHDDKQSAEAHDDAAEFDPMVPGDDTMFGYRG